MSITKEISKVDKTISFDYTYQTPIKFSGSITNFSFKTPVLVLTGSKRKEEYIDSAQFKEGYIIFEVYFQGAILTDKESFKLLIDKQLSYFCEHYSSKTEKVAQEVTHLDRREEKLTGEQIFTTRTYTDIVKSNRLFFHVPANDIQYILEKDSVNITLRIEGKSIS